MNEVSKIDIPFEELKHWVLESIKQHGDSFEFKNLCSTIGANLVKNGIAKSPHPEGYQAIYSPLQKEDENGVREVLWNLIIERVLTIGNYSNDSWPWLSLTDYGKKAINSKLPIPNDPTGYLNRIKKEVPQLDIIIQTYLIESIRTYNINLLLSSTITLGCAAEKALLILIDAYKESFKDNSKKINFSKKIEGKFIKTQFDEFDKSVQPILAQLPHKLREDYRIALTVFELIRYNRNQAGHPTGEEVDKDMLFSYLQAFISFSRYIYNFKEYLETNKHD